MSKRPGRDYFVFFFQKILKHWTSSKTYTNFFANAAQITVNHKFVCRGRCRIAFSSFLQMLKMISKTTTANNKTKHRGKGFRPEEVDREFAKIKKVPLPSNYMHLLSRAPWPCWPSSSSGRRAMEGSYLGIQPELAVKLARTGLRDPSEKVSCNQKLKKTNW